MNGFFCSRGHVHKVAFPSNSRLYEVDGLPPMHGKSVLLIQDVQTTQSDAVGMNECLGGTKILFKFGTSFGRGSITGLIFLGDKGASSDAVSKVKKWFEANRLSAAGKPVNVSNGFSDGKKFYPISLTTGVANAELNSLRFEIQCVMVEPSAPKK